MTAPELKPCPFCGRAMEITDDLRHYNHPVSACFGRHISIAASDIDRIEMWNRRADIAAAIREAALREAAYVAINACLVPPDGGSPTEAERLVCEEAYSRILALIGEKK